MTYKIDYNKDGKWYRIFDIEFNLTWCDSPVLKYFTDISVAEDTTGLILLAREIDENNVIKFIYDTADISSLRAELFEGGELWREKNFISHNEPKVKEDASEIHYKFLRPKVEARLKDYCQKYNLSLTID